jgi:hypothetical protein
MLVTNPLVSFHLTGRERFLAEVEMDAVACPGRPQPRELVMAELDEAGHKICTCSGCGRVREPLFQISRVCSQR